MSQSAYHLERLANGARFTTTPAPIPVWFWPLLLVFGVLGVALFFVPTILAIIAAIAAPLTWPKPASFVVDATGITTAEGFIPAERINSINLGNRHDGASVSQISMIGGGTGIAGAGMAIGASAVSGLHNAATGLAQKSVARRGYFVAVQYGGSSHTLAGGLEHDVAVGLANDVVRALRGGFSSQAQGGGLVFR